MDNDELVRSNICDECGKKFRRKKNAEDKICVFCSSCKKNILKANKEFLNNRNKEELSKWN